MTDPKLASARSQALLARQALLTTTHELQHRLSPSTLAEEARDVVKRKSEEIADGAVEVAMRRPVAVSATMAGIGALLGTAFLLRRRSRGRAD